MSENLGKDVVFIVTLLGVFIILVGFMPSGFFAVAPDYQQPYYPSYFQSDDIENIKFVETAEVHRAWYKADFDFRPSVNFKFVVSWGTTKNTIWIQHVTWELWVLWDGHDMNIVDEGYTELDLTTALEHVDPDSGACVLYPVWCNCITVKVWIVDSDQERNDLATAWQEGKVEMTIGLGMGQYEVTLSGWDIIARLLVFQAPNIHPVVNGIIALPFYTLVGYLIYRLILLAIPFVGG